MNELPKSPLGEDELLAKRSRYKLLAIISVALIPLLLATAMYYGQFALPKGKSNKGTLIWPPITLNSFAEVDAQHPENDLMKLVQMNKKWTLLVTGNSMCNDFCKESLHTVRQVNIALGKEADRVSRLLISSIEVEELKAIQQDYPNLIIETAKATEIANFEHAAQNNGAKIETKESNQWMVWVVDPLGNVILQYTHRHDGYDMIDDLKRVLKLSNIG